MRSIFEEVVFDCHGGHFSLDDRNLHHRSLIFNPELLCARRSHDGHPLRRDCPVAISHVEKKAASAGVDLSDALRDLQSAVVEANPKSRSAKTYPGQVTAIDAILAARPKQN